MISLMDLCRAGDPIRKQVTFQRKPAEMVVERKNKKIYITREGVLYMFTYNDSYNTGVKTYQWDTVAKHYKDLGYSVRTGNLTYYDYSGVVTIEDIEELTPFNTRLYRFHFGSPARVEPSKSERKATIGDIRKCINCGAIYEVPFIKPLYRLFCCWNCLCDYVAKHKEKIWNAYFRKVTRS